MYRHGCGNEFGCVILSVESGEFPPGSDMGRTSPGRDLYTNPSSGLSNPVDMEVCCGFE